jgi:conjugative transfer pilus assembly protein TraH
MSIQAPTVNAGCGGIDLHLGGFSFISKEQFVQTLRNIGSNALGYGFKIALQNICPTCDNVMTSLQNIADKANALNISSCQAAKGVVNAAANEVFNTQYDTKVMNWGLSDGIFSDATEAYRQVKNIFNPAQRQAALEQVKQNNPDRKEDLPTGNVTWQALSKVAGLSEVDKRRFMGLVGTIVFTNEGKINSYYPPNDKVIEDLITKDGQVEIPYPSCQNDAIDCMSPNFNVTVSADSYKRIVLEKMQTMQDMIINRQDYGTRKAELLSFVNATDIPVYKIVALSASLGKNNGDASTLMMRKYSSLIAAKYAQAYIGTVANTVKKALRNKIAQDTNSEHTKVAKDMIESIDKLEASLATKIQLLYGSAQSSYNIAQEVKATENTMIAGMSPMLSNSLQFSSNLGR